MDSDVLSDNDSDVWMTVTVTFSLMLSGRTFQSEGATYLKARWPYRFVFDSLDLGTSRSDLDADLRRSVWMYVPVGEDQRCNVDLGIFLN